MIGDMLLWLICSENLNFANIKNTNFVVRVENRPPSPGGVMDIGLRDCLMLDADM